MAALSNHKIVGPGFSNEMEVVRVEYDFANDAGATGVLDVFTADGNIVVKDFHLKVKTAAQSLGSPTLIIGVSGGDTDACLDATSGAYSALTGANAVIGPEATVPFYLADGGKIIQTIGSAALTAGKFEYCFTIMKAQD